MKIPRCPNCLLGENISEQNQYCPFCLYCVKYRKFPSSRPGGSLSFEYVFKEFLNNAYLPFVGYREAEFTKNPTIKQLKDFERFYLKIYTIWQSRKYTREEFNFLIMQGKKTIDYLKIGKELFDPLQFKFRSITTELRLKAKKLNKI